MARALGHPIPRAAATAVAVGFLLFGVPAEATAQHQKDADPHTSAPAAVAGLRSSPIVLDGRLDEPAWLAGTLVTDFTQNQPHEGEPAVQRTEVRFLFDTDALYIGARMYDTAGGAGVRTRLVRRDSDPEGFDYIQLIFDTFHDHLGRVAFAVNPSGVKGDSYGPNGADLDASWDAVWDVRTRIDSLGWTAEFRIPFAQLRFPRDSVQTWGLQVERLEVRTNERSVWSFWRLNEVGGPPRYRHLEGLRIARGPARAEILPYAVGRSTNDPHVAADDPFRDSRAYDARIGADVKYLLASNLTLTGTVNPDFGQVEVDPAVVNLTAFETYFQERRPFFVEGGGLFDFGGVNCFFCSDLSSPDLFYSRRIGRQPQGAANAYGAAGAGGFADIPQSTRILGAAKVTGTLAPRWTLATLDAVTARETARVADAQGIRSSTEVEPLTNYFVGRLSRDVGGGGFVRGMVTSVVRDLGGSSLGTALTGHGEAAGLETRLWWGRRTYRFMGTAMLSQVAGDSLAILRLQRSSARYFQRPDRRQGSNGLFTNAYDPSLRTMRGYYAYGRVAKEGGNWLFELSSMVKSPGFEANDVGFISQVDRIWMHGSVVRQFTTPNRFARNMVFIAGGQQAYNFSGDLVDRQFQAYAEATLLNYWDVGAFLILSPRRLDDQATRGGPVVGRAGGFNSFYMVSTDSRKPIAFSTQPVFGCRDGVCWYGGNLSVRLRPASNISVRVGPSFTDDRTGSWFVGSFPDSAATAMYGRRYVFGQLRQRTFAMETRLNVTVSPTLTLEVYLQPLIASAGYTRLHEYDRPRSLQRTYYGANGGTIAPSTGGYTIDPDGAGPAASFFLPDPDFNYRSLRGNAVIRWEFRPGSTLYLVWTQSREDTAPESDFAFGRDLRGLIGTKPTNVFLVKVSYWIGL
jgi:hypothetical protein